MVKEPFLFNCYKHHLWFLRERVRQVGNMRELAKLAKELKVVGSSVMDMYEGTHSPAELVRLIERYLEWGKHLGYDEYREWLMGNNGYRLVQIIDGSEWVLRLGENRERYIHFHPARNSNRTFRLHSTSLKTALMACVYCQLNKCSVENLTVVNKIRSKYLDLPPLKALGYTSRMWRVLCYL
jgi:hypothetical protein